MNSKIFHLPDILVSDKSGYDYFARIANEINTIEEDNIFFDMSECRYFEPNLCCILGSACRIGMSLGKTFHMSNMEPEMKITLENLGFVVRGEEFNENLDTNQVLYSVFENINTGDFIKYLETQLLNKPGFPSITPDLKTEIARNILEMYINAITHGKCESVYSCGYINKRRNSVELHFTLVDIGETIKKNVNSFLNKERSGGHAIKWATTGYNTTKIGKSGGLGLKLIQKFLKNNRGKIQIVSAEGFWEYGDDKINVLNLSNSFPGTIVNIIFNLKDKKQHYLDILESPSVSEIF